MVESEPMTIGRPDSPVTIYRTCVSRPSWWTAMFSNRVASVLVWVCAPWRWVTPNLVTSLNGVLGLALVGYIATQHGREAHPGWIALGLETYVILDCMDGQLARYTKKMSPLGATMDSLVDRIVHPLLFFAMAAWANDASGPEMEGMYFFLLATLMAAAFAILYPHTRFTEHLHGTKSGGFAPQTRGAMQRVRNLVVCLFGGMQVFLFLSVCAIWGRPDIFLYAATPILVSLALGRELLLPWQVSRRSD
jgi:phosphatidylglycerophosphate synthase